MCTRLQALADLFQAPLPSNHEHNHHDHGPSYHDHDHLCR